MTTWSRFRLRIAPLVALAGLLLSFSRLPAQTNDAGTVSIGLAGMASRYMGEFKEFRVGYGGEFLVKYNILENLGVQAAVGYNVLPWRYTSQNLSDYSWLFGPNAQPGSPYPSDVSSSGQVIRTDNASSTLNVGLDLVVNLIPEGPVNPYLFGGVELISWTPESSEGEELPNAAADRYSTSSFSIPAGAGFLFTVSDNLAINVYNRWHLTFTDSLDDFSQDRPGVSTPNDVYASIGLGVLFRLGSSDSDGDGLTNSREAELGTDPENPDTDGDGLLDGPEVLTHLTNPLKSDSDGDGLGDAAELNQHRTDPMKPDTDGDGLFDGPEVSTHRSDPLVVDTDKDGLADGDEVNRYRTDPTKPDTDGDGLADQEEVDRYKTDPATADTDGDGLADGAEVNQHRSDPTKSDTDGDGLADGAEVNTHRSNPTVVDTDGEGLADGVEVKTHRSDPTKVDTDGEGLNDAEEVNRTRTDPTKPDTDGDGITDNVDDCGLIKGVASTEAGRNGCPPAPKIGTKVDFPDILFVVNTDEFNFDVPETAGNLAKLLAYVNQCDRLGVQIEGHASSEGNPKRNQELSDLRAKRVVRWLIDQGVNPGKLQGAIGYGSSRPAVPEPTAAAAKKMPVDELEAIRRKNRRITVVVRRGCDE